MGKLHMFPVPSPAVLDAGVRVTQAETSVLGTTIFHEEAGQGRPLVLLHGLNDSHRTWRKVLPELAKTRRVLVPDLPGCGLSGRPDACYSLDWQARVMNAWLDALGMESVDLVGHSYGGGVAQYMLLFNAARIRRLALVASGGLGRQVAFELRLASLPRVVELFGQPFMGPVAARALRAVGGVIGEEEARWVTEVNCRPGTARAFARTVRDVIDWRGQSGTSSIVRTSCATCRRSRSLGTIAYPAEPRAPPPRTYDGRAAPTFEGCGHFPHRECPEAFVRSLVRFLDDPEASPVRCEFSEPAQQPGLVRTLQGLRETLTSALGPRRHPEAAWPEPYSCSQTESERAGQVNCATPSASVWMGSAMWPRWHRRRRRWLPGLDALSPGLRWTSDDHRAGCRRRRCVASRCSFGGRSSRADRRSCSRRAR